MTTPGEPTTPGWTSPSAGPTPPPPPRDDGAPVASPAPGSTAGAGAGAGAGSGAGPVPPGGWGPGYTPPTGLGARPTGPGQPPAPFPTAPRPGPGGFGPPGGGFRPAAPRPGIIPLRPLGLGEILDGAFRAIRANPRVMFGLSAIVVAVTVALQSVLQWYVGGLLAGELAALTTELDPAGTSGLGPTLAPSLATAATSPLVSVAITVLTGLLIVSVSRSVIGRTVTVGEVWSQSRRRVGLLLLFSFVTTTLLVAVWAGFIAVLVLLASLEQWAAAAVVGLLGGLALVAGTVWFSIRILLIPATLVLEGTGVRTALARGWRLTRGSFWRLLGIYALTSIIVGVVASLIATPASVFSVFFLGDPLMTSFGAIALMGVANVIAYTLTTAFMAAVLALLYIDVRMRREGLDVELARAAGEAD